jgi:hypothetical protein
MLDADAQATAQLGGAPSQGEPCEGCGAPLASDQRYCLECGRRRGGPRVDYRHYMATASQPAEAPAGGDPVPSPANREEGEAPNQQRDYAPLAAVGGIAVLGLMLLVGVLIGKGGDSGTAPAPSVIKVPATASAGSEEEKQSKSTADEGLGGGGAKKAKQSGGDGGGGGTGNAVKASEGDLEALGETSGEDYVKQSENLPNEIATPGKPPPIDKSKPPGGGEGGGEVIK